MQDEQKALTINAPLLLLEKEHMDGLDREACLRVFDRTREKRHLQQCTFETVR
jgi:hypothetical protein